MPSCAQYSAGPRRRCPMRRHSTMLTLPWPAAFKKRSTPKRGGSMTWPGTRSGARRARQQPMPAGSQRRTPTSCSLATHRTNTNSNSTGGNSSSSKNIGCTSRNSTGGAWSSSSSSQGRQDNRARMKAKTSPAVSSCNDFVVVLFSVRFGGGCFLEEAAWLNIGQNKI
eukprot:Rmarinus@m.22212